MTLELGLDINAKNKWGLTALHGAAYTDDAAVVEFLAARGASLNPLDWQNQTPLRVAQGHEICCSTYLLKPSFLNLSPTSDYDLYSKQIILNKRKKKRKKKEK